MFNPQLITFITVAENGSFTKSADVFVYYSYRSNEADKYT